ncbi:MAG: PAS domain-containing sensor histidine kinase, partial [Spirochaetales bacterium]
LYRYRRNRPVVSPGEDPGILYIQVNGSRIEAEQNSSGHQVLLVMNDITRLKRLESIRRDFVANVSHELKSPITSIQGFVETLESGALQDPEKAGRFLGIIAKQAARLNSITDDLLSLSRVEQTGTEGIAFARTRLTDVVSHAVSEYASKAEKLSIALLVSVPEDLEADLNAPLMEQALMNLIDNALKYGRGGLEVRISAGAEDSAGNKDAAAGGKEIRISVRDFGEGIPKASLPRIFERFYTVDKSRSKELGGTGLGLALVKHIMIAHGGSVSVESEQGAGSTFTLHLPAGRKDA